VLRGGLCIGLGLGNMAFILVVGKVLVVMFGPEADSYNLAYWNAFRTS